MAIPKECPDDIYLLQNKFCLNEVSKNVKGKLKLRDTRIQKCTDPKCETLISTQALEIKLVRHSPCDTPLSKYVSGVLTVDRLATAFKTDGKKRGVHAGTFTLKGAGGDIWTGKMSGITNAGTHRAPVFKECQVCNESGVLEGELCGFVTTAVNPALKESRLVATYRIKFPPHEKGGEGLVEGTIEGVIIVPCKA